jgi:hypothetical protein
MFCAEIRGAADAPASDYDCFSFAFWRCYSTGCIAGLEKTDIRATTDEGPAPQPTAVIALELDDLDQLIPASLRGPS